MGVRSIEYSTVLDFVFLAMCGNDQPYVAVYMEVITARVADTLSYFSHLMN